MDSRAATIKTPSFTRSAARFMWRRSEFLLCPCHARPKCRASTNSICLTNNSWMAGTSPAMTKRHGGDEREVPRCRRRGVCEGLRGRFKTEEPTRLLQPISESGRPSGRPLTRKTKVCRSQPDRGSHRPGPVWRSYQNDYFGTPTNRAPVNLPSAPMSGA